ncbi:MAG: helix-turn-helix domain-containing protein [Pseudonocardiaceae bacterium]
MSTGGERVAELRKERGITQVALARRAGISVSLLSKIEIGHSPRASPPPSPGPCRSPWARSTAKPRSPGSRMCCWRTCARQCAATTSPARPPCPTPPSCAWTWTRPPPWCNKPIWQVCCVCCPAC